MADKLIAAEVGITIRQWQAQHPGKDFDLTVKARGRDRHIEIAPANG